MCLAVPGKVLNISGSDPMQRMGQVSFGGIVKDVNLVCVPEAQIGDYVIVHVGMAISRLDENEAQEVFSYLQEMDRLGRANDPEVLPDEIR